MFKSLKDLLGAAAAPAPGVPDRRREGRSRDERRAPLPEVSEVDWSEWESSVFHSELDALLSGPTPLRTADPSPAKRDGPAAAALPEVREVDWSVWEDSVRGQLDAGSAGPKRRR